MTTNVFAQDGAVRDLGRAEPPVQLADPADVAARAWTWALESCARRMGLAGTAAVADQMRQGNNTVRLHCCHGLAEQVAGSLWSSQENIQAVYAPECDACPQGFCLEDGDHHVPFVHLLIWARRKSPALGSRAAALGNALANACQDLIGMPDRPTVLRVQVIADADLEKLFGAGQRERWSTRLQAWLLAMNEPAEALRS